MVAFGFAEVLMIAVLASGTNSSDVADIVEPAHYFKSRDIVVTLDRMIDIAMREPKDGKAQIMQLTALRHLANESDAFKKASNYASNREAIEEIAAGKRANDPQGFAQEYAQRLLMKLDGKKAASPKQRSLREDALGWFPADVKFAAALNQKGNNLESKDVFKDLLKLMPANAKAEMYGQLERVGNVRVERIAFGFVEAKNRAEHKIFVRVTGKANPEWILSAAQGMIGDRGAQIDRSKAPDGTPLITLRTGREPNIVAVGDTDLLVVGYTGGNAKADDLLAAVLEVRAKKKPSAAAGQLKDGLAKIPDKARRLHLRIGDLPTPNWPGSSA